MADTDTAETLRADGNTAFKQGWTFIVTFIYTQPSIMLHARYGNN
jgi:hypothetical protein